jgi:hypothetical protein
VDAGRPKVDAVTWDDGAVSDDEREDERTDVGRAPICPACGVTALPVESYDTIDAVFVCENPDCDAFGDPVGS